MTDTEVEIEDEGGCYATLPNHTLAQVLYDIVKDLPQEPWSEEELAFASTLNNDPSLPNQLFPGGVTPITYGTSGGSTDVGDVQHIAPGVFFYTACYNIAAAGHSWQSAACAGHSMGLKGMLHAARAMAIFGEKVMSDPELLAAAKREFEENVAKDPYVCPFPENYKLPGQK
jgi:aminobenzoyl-glutamate utilization protein B